MTIENETRIAKLVVGREFLEVDDQIELRSFKPEMQGILVITPSYEIDTVVINDPFSVSRHRATISPDTWTSVSDDSTNYQGQAVTDANLTRKKGLVFTQQVKYTEGQNIPRKRKTGLTRAFKFLQVNKYQSKL